MIAEAEDPELKASQEKMGFRHEALEKLQSAREKLAEKMEPRDLRLYQRIGKRLKHPIVPVEDRTCLGCYMALPTSAVPPNAQAQHFLTCENCGRILYWIE